MLKKNLCKTAIFYYLIHPLFFVSAILTVVFVSFRFFIGQKFFISGIGTSDLRSFFEAIPIASILIVPALAFCLNNLIRSDSLPYSNVSKLVSIAFSAFFAFVFPVILLFSIPVCVNFFGDVEFGQVFSGFFGIFLFSFASVSLSVFLFSAIPSQSVALILSVAILWTTNFIQSVPLYFDVGPLLTYLFQKLSFSFAFAPFGKGILDSRSIVYYIFASMIFILLAAFFENRRLEKKMSRLTIIFVVLIFVFSSIGVERLYFRIDLTDAKNFSVSNVSKELISKMDEPLRITYFRSKGLSDLYPQSSDVLEFLEDFSLSGKNVSLSVKNISSQEDAEKFERLGLQGQQIKSEKGTKTEFITVYSAILIQYVDKNSLIPFVASIENLEYDLCQRLKTLISGKQEKINIVIGNALSPENRYDYIQLWLQVRGFETNLVSDFEVVPSLEKIQKDERLLVLGSRNLSQEQCAAIESAVMRGVPTIISTSPYSVDLENGWGASKNVGDNLIPALNSWGFSFGKSLVQDISCYPLTMESADSGTSEYHTMNYPLWISALPQEKSRSGATFFWASPMYLYGGATGFCSTTSMAWLQNESNSSDSAFVTSPFSLAKSAKEAGSMNGTYILSATTETVSGYYQKGSGSVRLTVISGELFLDSIMTGYISSENAGDFRNFDFTVSEFLRLGGEGEIVSLMEKGNSVRQLYKISETNVPSARLKIIIVHFVVIPILIVGFFIIVQVKRNGKN